ncbi:MAG: phosphoenolpyruvate carboxykinase [Elusimicrobia bacterium RIFOXYB12_FULL_50_12]|nr:MAG: phosphoenolpyruvate carboxykinase [Elusimicrobia bacterium RIFOXYA12_FULL_49_49]OGS16416.1 MAG: phosphoenolpyruvate carboxykinase [Elusimicrobia bacterium RIFOXYA2_FULL_47_53]OGS27207.1 MAG: phosphoenolpyruvate carboxykinase [Elusimicrobia bacterium RIFOXYB12_FULL_50_12]OGS30407.1 MAG: phosphoenolpyruvate carboxykinase [Elusimicrobia bacterium RIFOXYB2_FULL_46_23]
MATHLEQWVQKQAELTKPDKIYWMDGSEAEAKKLVKIGLEEEKINGNNIFKELNQKEYPNAFFHRSHPTDVSRTEHLTFVCVPNKEDAGPNNNWMEPSEGKAKMLGLFDGCMKGRTMYVIPYTMGNPESPYSKACVQLSDSAYVAVSMRIMTRVGRQATDKIGNSENFAKSLHSIGDLNPERRFIMHFPEENLIMSFGSGYGGNALLGKKCFSLRIASALGKKEGWLAEHMIIIGVESPDGKVTYFLGAFPSACGKTNLALLDPVLKGYKVRTLGDDIAWINVGKDGRLYAINPEMGFFGVAPGTGDKTNPIMIKTLKNNKYFPTLFTNTAIDNDTNTPWWEGLSDKTPENLTDWQGNKYDASSGKPAAHPNSRFTVSALNCPSMAEEFNSPQGVPISGIIFGGRRKTTIPLVYETKSWDEGVFAASIMGSETTAAAAHQSGVVRRDPMAMLPFCGYNMGDYFKHWLGFGKKVKHLPKVFMVNWFRKGEDGSFLWPGFRENSRILKWMIDRIEGKAGAKDTPIGLMPKDGELDLSGLDIPKASMDKLLEVNKTEWAAEIPDIEKFYSQFGDRVPAELKKQLEELKKKFA